MKKLLVSIAFILLTTCLSAQVKKPTLPHQIVIDMGENIKIKALRHLPRGGRSTAGMIKDYRLFVKTTPFKF